MVGRARAATRAWSGASCSAPTCTLAARAAARRLARTGAAGERAQPPPARGHGALARCAGPRPHPLPRPPHTSRSPTPALPKPQVRPRDGSDLRDRPQEPQRPDRRRRRARVHDGRRAAEADGVRGLLHDTVHRQLRAAAPAGERPAAGPNARAPARAGIAAAGRGWGANAALGVPCQRTCEPGPTGASSCVRTRRPAHKALTPSPLRAPPSRRRGWRHTTASPPRCRDITCSDITLRDITLQ